MRAGFRGNVARSFVDEANEPFLNCEIYEFYDLRTRRYMIFQMDSGVELFSGPIPYSHRFSPFVHQANYRKKPADFWGFWGTR